MERISEKILVSGPWITDKEVVYAADAARNGWNHHCFDYINRFEALAREYLNVEYAIGMSSCTGALHMAILSLGIGKDDEVIVPESTWIATINALEYVQAVPVFVDIDEVSWTIDPQKIEEAITEKTKAIIVVHLYGHPCNMEKIMKIAKAHDLYVIEDAAQSMGGEICGKKTGTIGDVGCFSFHGSKSIVMGEGGLLVTNNKEVFEKAKFYSDQGKHPTRRFFNIAIGYKYKLSNLQAAVGAAQMERVEEIVAKKRQIFLWYQERLQGLEDVRLNAEIFGAKNTYWMPTIVLGDSYTIDGYQLSEELLKRNIDTRPFFYPLSMMPMFEGKKRFCNEVAYKYASRAVNLPAGCCLTEEEVDYICAQVKNILQPDKYLDYQLKGWLKFREIFKEKLNELKQEDTYAKFKVINVDYAKRLIEIEGTLTTGDYKNIVAFGETLAVGAIFIKSFEPNEIKLLNSLGFDEVLRKPQGNIDGKGMNMIDADFVEGPKYEYLLKLRIK